MKTGVLLEGTFAFSIFSSKLAITKLCFVKKLNNKINENVSKVMGINKMFYPSLLIQKLFVNLRCISLLLLDKGVAKICNKFKKEQINPLGVSVALT